MDPAAETLTLRLSVKTSLRYGYSKKGKPGGIMHNMPPVFCAHFSQNKKELKKLTDIFGINLLK